MKSAIIVSDATEQTLRGGVTYVRPSVAAFALKMEAALAANDQKPGWKNSNALALVEALVEQADRLVELLMNSPESGEIGRRTANVANYAMMIDDNLTKPRPTDSGNTTEELHQNGQ